MPGPVSSDLIAPNVFVFLGNRQPAKNIDYQKVLDTFDRLLPLYKYVESGGKTDPVSFKKEKTKLTHQKDDGGQSFWRGILFGWINTSTAILLKLAPCKQMV